MCKCSLLLLLLLFVLLELGMMRPNSVCTMSVTTVPVQKLYKGGSAQMGVREDGSKVMMMIFVYFSKFYLRLHNLNSTLTKHITFCDLINCIVKCRLHTLCQIKKREETKQHTHTHTTLFQYQRGSVKCADTFVALISH